jgi:hypothetical protein
MDTDLDEAGIFAGLIFVQMRAYRRLSIDRAKFQQFQQNPENSDVTMASLMGSYSSVRQDWEDKKVELRSIRKVG